MKTTKEQRALYREAEQADRMPWFGSARDEVERLQGIITEAQHLCGAEPGNLLARIIGMKDENAKLRKRIEAFEACIKILYEDSTR